MKRILIIAMTVLGVSAFAQESSTNQGGSRLKVLILSLNNNSDTNTYAGSDYLKPVIFNSLYNFIGIIPSLDIPDQKTLQAISWTPEQLAQLAKDRGADLVIYGDYTLSGPAYDPRARLSLKIYSTENVVDVLSKTYNTPTDLEIFDTIDRVINDLSVELLKGKVEVAYLNFTGFRVGNEEYDIYVNDKIIASITNSDFELNLKILANTSYGVEIIRRHDKKAVHDSSFVLQPGVTARISHTAQATLDLKALKGRKKGSAYTLKLNDNPILDNQKYTNILGGVNYDLVVIEDATNLVYSNSFYLRDGGKLTLKPVVKYKGGGGGPISLVLAFNDESMLQAAIQWYFHPKFWAAGGAGLSLVPFGTMAPLFLNAYAGAGYTILGDKDSSFRLGAEVSLHYVILAQNIMPLPGANSHPLSVGAFVSAEWRALFLKVGTYYDISNNRFYYFNMGYPNIVGGFKIRFGGKQSGPGIEGLGLFLGVNDESMLLAALRKSLGEKEKLWLALGLSASLWPKNLLEGSMQTTLESGIFFMGPYAAAGYHFVGDAGTDLRIGAELAFRYTLIDVIPSVVKTQLGNVITRPFSVGLFARGEWRFLYLKAGYYYDLSNGGFSFAQPTISAGVVLNFK